MKIMWIGNLALPEIALKLGKRSNLGGWLSAISSQLVKQDNIEFVYCYPQDITQYTIVDEIDDVKYYGFYEDMESSEYSQLLSSEIFRLYEIERPDVVHIFGTEYLHSYCAVESGIDLNKVVVSIQGVITMVGQHFCEGIPVIERYRPYIRNGKIKTIEAERNNFIQRSIFEKKIFKKIVNCEGRTDFDYACVKLFNPNIKYFKCNRILRDCFYEDLYWSYDKCEKNSIFISQAAYPAKGLHIFLDALHYVKEQIPDVKVYIGGPNIYHVRKEDRTPYASYITSLIDKNCLNKNIYFLGDLSAIQMRKQYLKSNVYVMPSIIENSPNSLGEAMMLGVPCIASDVGGVCNMITHDVDGYIYRSNASYMLANYIIKILNGQNIAERISKEACRTARKIYDIDANVNSIMDMYEKISISVE